MNKEEAKEKIKALVDKYERIKESGELKQFNEERTKQVFIRPLFEALGWDFEEEVYPEEKASKGWVDYSFKINGITKFFLEAKKLSEDLDLEKWAEQAITYAWHKGIFWAVLTDFEGLKVFNAELRSPNPLQSGLFFLNYDQYITRFEDLWLLSRESMEKNLIDEIAESRLKKGKRVPVDKQLLSDLTVFRDLLAKNIVKRNQKLNLTQEDIDEAIQRLLDRLIFIRSCEDKGLEDPLLKPLIRNREKAEKLNYLLNDTFDYFQEIYDGNLFKPHLSDDIVIDYEVLEKVIKGLYKTNYGAHYDFSLIDADVLGNIYEQYLGHILKKTEKRIKLTNGKAHRKEHGVYYTPTYIVDYIIKNTIGELAKDKNFDVNKIKILDPACGSGSFLIKAYDYLQSLRQKELRNQKISYEEKVKILKDNIFGVDLDEKAVDIAQLNLLLKVAEKKQKLPLLQDSIKCGNSLIDDKNIAGKKAFKWKEEFKEIMDNGGFDVVIGNPPYIRIHEFDEKRKKYFANYDTATGQYDIYVLFIEKAIKLLKEGGILGFIVSNKFLVSDYGIRLRRFILEKTKIKLIADVSNMNVFKDASVYPIIIILEKSRDQKEREKSKIKVIQNITTEKELIENKEKHYNQQSFYENKNFIMDITSSNKKVINQIENKCEPLGKISKITRGFRPPPKELVYSVGTKDLHKYLIGKNLQNKYNIKWSGNFVKYNEDKIKESKPLELFLQPKILIRDIGKKFNACYDDGKYLCLKTIYFIYNSVKCDLKYILGILNSKLMLFYFKSKFAIMHIQGGYLRFRKQFLDQLPIKQISESQQQPIIKLVDEMLSLNKQLNELGDKKTDERARLEKEIKKIDAEIDELVYKIYGITDKEKEIIEESLG